MSEYNAPRRGSMAYYPRVRSKKETPSMKASGKEAKALNFLCYKAGMTQIMGKNKHKGSPSFGHEVVLPATIIECPPLKVFGVRAYTKAEIGVVPLSDALAENVDNEIMRKINNFKKKSQKNKDKKENTEKKSTKEKKIYEIADFEKEINDIEYFTLLIHTQPKKISLKKTPDISEVFIGGKKEEQLNYAKQILGKEINFDEVFSEGDFLDIKAVTTGKGIQGVVKRFNVRMLRPKAKTRRVVGSISPWHPTTVMFTVARPGQMGYQNRTEYNKKLVKISDKTEEVNSKSGFSGYGHVQGKFAVIVGSIPGPSKRCIALRKGIRPVQKRGIHLEAVEKILVK